MEKIKQVFSPGSSKDDEVMYGDSEARRKESIANTSGQQQPAKLYPVEGAAGQKESGGILNQITNPDGAKYDERRFETSATSEPDPNKLHTDPASKDRSGSVIGQILNPGGKKYDEQKFGETATTAGTEQVHEKRGVGEKLYPEHGREENQAHYPGLGKTEAAGVVDPNTKLQTKPEHEKDHSILRQILNPNGNKRDDVAYGSTAQASGNNVDVAGASSTLADRSVAHGSGASGVATSSAPRYNEPQSDVLDRSHPLRDGSGATTDPTNPVGTSRTTDAAILGTGAAATGGLASTSETSHAYGGSDTTHHPQGSTLDCDGQPTQGYIHHVKGPHSTDIANQLDPNISGSSGLAAGEQQRNVAAAGAGAGAGAGIGAGIGSGPTTNTTTTTTTTTTGTGYNSSSSHQAGGATVPSQPYSSTSTAPGTTGQTSSHHHEGHLNQDKSAHIRNDEHEKHEKPGLLQKIMHPRSHGEDSHQRTSVDEHGRNVLHKDPPS